jgi:hypothetical protein
MEKGFVLVFGCKVVLIDAKAVIIQKLGLLMGVLK